VKQSKRGARVANLVRQETAAQLLALQDPLLAEVTLTDVRVSPDLRIAHVYWTPLDSSDAARAVQVKQALDLAAPSLRRHLGSVMSTKYVPQLNFHIDETLASARRIEELLGGLDLASESEAQ